MSVIHVLRRAGAAVRVARRAFIIAVAIVGAPLAAAAGTVTIAWDPSPETGVRGYVVHVGTQPGVATQTVDVGNVGVYTYPNATPGVVYYFSVSAYGDNGATSLRSTEITAAVRSVPPAPVLMAPLNITVAPTPSFTWAAVGGATSYLLKVNDAAQPEKILQSYTAVQAGCGAGTGTCSVIASVPLASGTATWTVQAINSIGAGPWSAAGAFTIGAGSAGEAGTIALIPRTGWRLHYVDSQELVAENGAATNAFDGKPTTIWHTQYKGTLAPMPHELQIDLGKAYSVKGFRYLPRQDMANGRIARFEFYVSADGQQWGAPVATGTLNNAASEQQIAFAAANGRYVRLRALSEVSGNFFTTLAELNVLGDAVPTIVPQLLAKSGWKLKYVDSQETVQANNGATNAFDGNPNTFWHSSWSGTTAAIPHEIQIDLGASAILSGFRYLPRQDGGTNGRIAKYEFYVSADGVNWGTPVVAGTFANDAREQEVLFAAKAGRYIRLRALSEVAGRVFTSMAELGVLGVPSVAPQLLEKTGWKLKFVDSEETTKASNGAINAFDGNPNTMWHSSWSGTTAAIPHEIQIDLGASYSLSAFRYLPRQDGGTNGRIAKYEFYVSADGVNWGSPVVAGTFVNDAREKEVLFASKTGRYIRLRALSEVAGAVYTSAAELGVVGSKP